MLLLKSDLQLVEGLINPLKVYRDENFTKQILPIRDNIILTNQFVKRELEKGGSKAVEDTIFRLDESRNLRFTFPDYVEPQDQIQLFNQRPYVKFIGSNKEYYLLTKRGSYQIVVKNHKIPDKLSEIFRKDRVLNGVNGKELTHITTNLLKYVNEKQGRQIERLPLGTPVLNRVYECLNDLAKVILSTTVLKDWVTEVYTKYNEQKIYHVRITQLTEFCYNNPQYQEIIFGFIDLLINELVKIFDIDIILKEIEDRKTESNISRSETLFRNLVATIEYQSPEGLISGSRKLLREALGSDRNYIELVCLLKEPNVAEKMLNKQTDDPMANELIELLKESLELTRDVNKMYNTLLMMPDEQNTQVDQEGQTRQQRLIRVSNEMYMRLKELLGPLITEGRNAGASVLDINPMWRKQLPCSRVTTYTITRGKISRFENNIYSDILLRINTGWMNCNGDINNMDIDFQNFIRTINGVSVTNFNIFKYLFQNIQAYLQYCPEYNSLVDYTASDTIVKYNPFVKLDGLHKATLTRNNIDYKEKRGIQYEMSQRIETGEGAKNQTITVYLRKGKEVYKTTVSLIKYTSPFKQLKVDDIYSLIVVTETALSESKISTDWRN